MLQAHLKKLLVLTIACPVLTTGFMAVMSRNAQSDAATVTEAVPQTSQPVESAKSIEIAMSESLTFRLVNATNLTLMRFYASPTGYPDWESDILGSNVLLSGGSVNITIADGRTTCNYDIRGVFENGAVADDYNINICELGSYSFLP